MTVKPGVARLYCRLSPRPDGRYEGVADQEKWGREYAAHVWPGVPVVVYADEGISAASADRPPKLEQLLADIANQKGGPTVGLWAVEQSRFERGSEERWFELARLLPEAGVYELHTKRDGVLQFRDTMSAIRAILSIGERRRMLERQKDRLAEIAAKGEPPGVRPFGYIHARNERGERTYAVVEEQAAAIRFAAEKVLAGWSLASVAAELDKRGVRGTHGGRFSGSSVKGWLTAPSITGLRVHSGQVVGDGNWPPILDRDTFRAVGARLVGPRVVKRHDGGSYPVTTAHKGSPGRRYLLTGGLAVCGVCGAALIGAMKQLRNAKGVTTKPYLLCQPSRATGGKGCVGMALDPVEAYVVDELLDHLESPRFLASLAPDTSEEERARLVTELDSLDAQRVALMERWTSGKLRQNLYEVADDGLAAREAEVQAELAAIPTSSERIDLATIRADWPELPLDEQRAILRRHIAAVWIDRATSRGGGRPGVDLGRVRISWAELDN